MQNYTMAEYHKLGLIYKLRWNLHIHM